MLNVKRVRVLKAREMRKMLNVSRGNDTGLSVVQQMTGALSLLGIEVLDDGDTRSIILRKKRPKAEKWWDALDKRDAGFEVGELSVLNSSEKCIICRTLSGLRVAITQIKYAKLGTKLRREQARKLEKLSAWGVASAIVLQYAVSRNIFICGQLRGDVGWCCEWMMGDVDEDTGPADCFTVDLPLKLSKGCAVNVKRNGTLVVRIDGTKALKLMKVAAVNRKDLKIVLFRAGGETLADRFWADRYWQWRPFVAVVAADKPSKFWKSDSVIYLG